MAGGSSSRAPDQRSIQHSQWTVAIAALMIRARYVLAATALLMLAIAYPASRQLKFDRSLTAMFSPDDPTAQDYQVLQDSFGGNSVVMLVYYDEQLLEPDGLSRNDSIAKQVAGVTGVNGVLSISKLDAAVRQLQPMSFLAKKTPFGQDPDNPVSIGFDSLFAGYTHSTDHTRAGVLALLEPGYTTETIEGIRRVAYQLPSEFEAKVIGEPILVQDGFALIERDGARLATLTIALLSIVVALSLADLRFVLLTGILIGWSVVLTRGFAVLFGINLSLISTILTAIVAVIAVAAALHLGVRYNISRSRGQSGTASTRTALSRLILPIILTCATDAAGFAALNASGILPIRQFGTMIAIASIMVLVGVALWAPAVMMIGFDVGSSARVITAPLLSVQRAVSRHLRRGCLLAVNWVLGHRGVVLSSVVICLFVILLGIGRTRTETSFLSNFRQSSHLSRDYDDVESHFGGAGFWDVVLAAPAEITPEYLAQVRELETALRQINVGGTCLSKVLSLADAEQVLSKSSLTSMVPPSARLSLISLAIPSFFKALLSEPDRNFATADSDPRPARRFRIMLRSGERMDAESKYAFIHGVEQVVAQHTSTDQWQQALSASSARALSDQGWVTGFYVLMSRLVGQLIRDQWRCFFAAGVLVWLLLGVFTRSPRLATAAMLPNLLPVFFVLALLGLSGQKMNMGAAMIAAVSIGLSIDGSVHFLSSYQRCRRRGRDARSAAIHATGTIGAPVLLATVALVIGFAALSTSEFVPTATFGTLVSAVLALGTLVNLTLLPAFVFQMDR